MKTKFGLLLFFALVLCQYSYGQLIKEVKVGASLVNVQYNNSLLNKASYARTGYFAGIVSQQELGEKFFLRQELVYANKGNVQENSATTHTARIHMHYLTLPLLAGYKLTPKLSAYAGPELAVVGSIVVNIDRENIQLRHWEDYNKFDIGASVGLKYQLTSRIGVDLRYTHGFRNVRDISALSPEEGSIAPTYDGKNRVLQAGLNYSFRKKQ